MPSDTDCTIRSTEAPQTEAGYTFFQNGDTVVDVNKRVTEVIADDYLAQGIPAPACLIEYQSAECAVLRLESPEVTYWVLDGRIALVRTVDSGARTRAGVGVGTSLDVLRATYSSQDVSERYLQLASDFSTAEMFEPQDRTRTRLYMQDGVGVMLEAAKRDDDLVGVSSGCG